MLCLIAICVFVYVLTGTMHNGMMRHYVCKNWYYS